MIRVFRCIAIPAGARTVCFAAKCPAGRDVHVADTAAWGKKEGSSALVLDDRRAGPNL